MLETAASTDRADLDRCHEDDEWAIARRYMTMETISGVCEDRCVDAVKLAALTGSTDRATQPGRRDVELHHIRGRYPFMSIDTRVSADR